ncbi:hypothetical protein ABID21_003638 [Pseudorhizobium tarimense]|uniref:Uncharacterized protein n=1 Tax=Pseudorhizobium tarimense TaxID=1079109 RepID=A0ABV2HAD5_9HYPH|nr:hypothetical protein [Pseudorhizobium tarimense]MCJ8520491.1 hypothetical protein [Pseudorhizobium tarimense]
MNTWLVDLTVAVAVLAAIVSAAMHTAHLFDAELRVSLVGDVRSILPTIAGGDAMQQATGNAPDEPYEQGMHIIFDVITRCAVVTFRGKMDIIGPCPDRSAAIAAAEALCRESGWGRK